MNKEDYIKDRETGVIDLQSAYEVYKDTNPERPKVDITQFTALFTLWIRTSRPFVDGYFNYWDEKFGIEKESVI